MEETITEMRESDKIESQLRRLILNLELNPGVSYSEAALIKRYGWGRTPLREAFQRLAEQSLLQVNPRQGITIAGLNVFEFIELMDAMVILIGPAAVLACKRIKPEGLVLLEQIIAQGEQAAENQDFPAVADCDFRFHQVLAEATGNRYLCRFLLHLHQVAIRFNYAAWQRDGQANFSLSEHHQIVQAFRDRDPYEAKRLMLAHIENARQRVLGSMAPGETE